MNKRYQHVLANILHILADRTKALNGPMGVEMPLHFPCISPWTEAASYK